jgi:hypothetical protein
MFIASFFVILEVISLLLLTQLRFLYLYQARLFYSCFSDQFFNRFNKKMLRLLVRIPAMRLNSSAPLQVLRRTQSIAVNQQAANRQQQALIRGGVALIAIGGAGYLLNKVKTK